MGRLQRDPCIHELEGEVDRFAYQAVRRKAHKYRPRYPLCKHKVYLGTPSQFPLPLEHLQANENSLYPLWFDAFALRVSLEG